MRKSKSWAPSRSGAACADTAEGCDGCCCDVDTPGAGDSCAVDDNKLSCSVASKQIELGFIGLTIIGRQSAVEKGGIPQPISGIVAAIPLQKLPTIRRHNPSRTRTDLPWLGLRRDSCERHLSYGGRVITTSS